MWETTVMHKQVSGWTVNFGQNFPESPFLELKTRKPPPPPISEKFRFGMTKVYSGIPPISENFRFGMTKLYSGIPPPFRKASDLGWPEFYSRIPPLFGKLQIWDDQSLLQNTLPHFRKLQIRDDQSLLQITPPPFWKASDLGWPKFTREYPPNENCQRVQVRDFQNTESYYMWRLYPTRLTTGCTINQQYNKCSCLLQYIFVVFAICKNSFDWFSQSSLRYWSMSLSQTIGIILYIAVCGGYCLCLVFNFFGNLNYALNKNCIPE